MKKFAIIAIIIVIIDQVSKIYIKTHFGINSEAFDIFDWFKIVFVENPGMAYGMNWGGPLGKSLLAILRWIMCGAIVWAVTIGPWKKYMKNNYFIIPMSLILAGALGNVIDSTFYGVMFDSGTTWNSELHQWNRWYPGVSQLNFEGYAPYSKVAWWICCISLCLITISQRQFQSLEEPKVFSSRLCLI